jgi:hypothetical protein
MDIDEALVELKSETNIRFTRLLTITEKFFGKPRNREQVTIRLKLPGKENQESIFSKEKVGKQNHIKLSKLKQH